VTYPRCPYCSNFSDFVTGKEIYPHRSDLFNLNFYRCEPCKAYVGTHKGTTQPLGRLANAELRKAKSEAHRAFDPLWRNKTISRTKAYKWLAKKLDMPVKDCHIGMFNVDQCRGVLEIMKSGYT